MIVVKGFFKWFQNSSKMKRWMFVIIIGILLACYGIAEILVLKEMSFKEVGKIIAVFIVGFLSIIIGLVGLNKRTLEVLVESTDDRMENRKNVNVKSLIFNKTVYNQGPNIVVIGGGTGLNTVLSGLKKYTNNLTAIVTVSSYGEQVSDSRRELGTMPLDDIKDSMVALANEENQMSKLLNYNFRYGKLRGLSFSDIYFLAMKEVNKDFAKSIINSNEVLNIIGKVLPVTLDEMNITAELANGYIVTEKSRIPEVVYDKITKINRIYLNPSNCRPAPGVIEAIKNADCIIVGPGSLYTNVIPNLLVNGVAKAIKESTAIKVYISNIMTEPGQTDNYSVSDHLNAIIDHCGKGIVDYCIYDTGEIIPEMIKKYNMEGQDLVEQNIDKVKGITFLQRNLAMISDGYIRHDPTLVASSIIELICDDLKYQDKQNDPQYMMLNNKLREDKRIHKIQKQMKKKEKRLSKHPERKSKHQKGKSKFANKYSERIDSIRTADERIQKEKKRLEKKNAERIRKERSNRNLENAKRANTAKRMNTGKRMANNNKRSNQNRMEQLRKEMMQTLENNDIHSGKH